MSIYLGEPIVPLVGLNLKRTVREILSTLDSKPVHQRDGRKIYFLRYVLRSLGDWEVGNWYTDDDMPNESYMITGITVDLHRETWSIKCSTYRDLLEAWGSYVPGRVHSTPYGMDRRTHDPVWLVKLYDRDDMCLTHRVVHLVMQDGRRTDDCMTPRECDQEQEQEQEQEQDQEQEQERYYAWLREEEGIPQAATWDNSDAAWSARMG
jgi:hypothetical protein